MHDKCHIRLTGEIIQMLAQMIWTIIYAFRSIQLPYQIILPE